MKKILVADDEEKIRQIVRKYLEKEGFDVIECIDGQEVIDFFKRETPDLLILDIMMPEVDGWEVCREIKRDSQIPIIMLTAKDEELDRILGLEMGADDYVVKPFSPRELVARVKAVQRRVESSAVSTQNVLNYEGISIDLDARKVTINGQDVTLTPKEFDMLHYLAKRPGKAFNRDNILLAVWGYDYFGDTRTVDTHINRLREKLSKASEDFSYIHTVWGVGYKFEPKSKNNDEK